MDENQRTERSLQVRQIPPETHCIVINVL